jgi:hypothetical protein
MAIKAKEQILDYINTKKVLEHKFLGYVKERIHMEREVNTQYRKA